MDQVKHFYIRDKKNAPVGCVVYEIVGGKLVFGTAAHNPIDRFDKARMIQIATGRKEVESNFILLEVDGQSREAVRLIKQFISSERCFPHRIRNPLRNSRTLWDRTSS